MVELEREATRWFGGNTRLALVSIADPHLWFTLRRGRVAPASAGLVAFTTAAPANPIARDGVVESASSPDASSQYPGVDPRLAGDPTAYRLEVSEFASVPDASTLPGQPMTVWVDDGTTHVLAIRVAKQTFKSSWMDNPKAKLEGNYVTALTLGVVTLFFAWAIWWLVPHKRPGSPG